MSTDPRFEKVRNECRSLIADSSLLNSEDRALLIEIVDSYDVDRIPELSFIASETRNRESNGYSIEFADNGPYRIVKGRHPSQGHVGIALDADGAFLMTSNHVFHNPYNLVKAIPALMRIRSDALEGASFRLGSGVVYTERWPPSYGHLVDEMFTTAAAKDEVAELMDYLPLVDFPVSSGLTSRPPLTNVAEMAQAIFQGGSLNLSAVKESSLSVERLALIRNRISDTCFHRFPTAISERIVKMSENNQDLADESDSREYVFLTRGVSADSKRRIPAQQAMIEEAESRGFRVMNPETSTLPHLVRSISSCTGLVCSWGGALSNAAFLKPDTRVGILKLPAYQDESLNVIFGHMIEEHALSTRVMKVDEQEDNLHEFQQLLDWVVGAQGRNSSSGES